MFPILKSQVTHTNTFWYERRSEGRRGEDTEREGRIVEGCRQQENRGEEQRVEKRKVEGKKWEESRGE